MSLTFFGWDVVYDDKSLVLELGAEQEPQKGDSYTMYHGTNLQTARLIITNGFRQSPDGMLGPGVYVSRNQQKAERYPLKSPSNRVVLQLRVNAGRVKRIDKDNHPMQKSWNAAGYDTAWVPPNCGMQSVPSGLEEDCVFDPQRIVVTSIAKAPNPTILAELKQLVSQKRAGIGRGGDMQVAVAGGVCTLCKRKTTPDRTHTLLPCWGCGQNICTLMTKHTCSASA